MLPRFRVVLIAIGTLGCAGSDSSPWLEDPLAEPQAISLFGEELYALADTTGAIAAADSALAEAPDDVDRLIASGRVRRNFWQYRQAMALYTRASELAPQDWRPYRFRGHRHISTRNFPAAVADLEQARDLAPLNWDVSYHLGLAYFLAGRFSDAAAEYGRCLALATDEAARAAHNEEFRSCSQNGDDPESYVAMTEWAVRALRRAGRAGEAEQLLGGVNEEMGVEENVAYYHNLLYQKGVMSAEQLLSPSDDTPYRLETVGFGVANALLVQGDTVRAREILQRVAEDPWWPGFGRIAAEAELARLATAPSS